MKTNTNSLGLNLYIAGRRVMYIGAVVCFAELIADSMKKRAAKAA